MGSIIVTAVFALHIISGMAALLAGAAAICVRKGGALHRRVGDGFVVAMIVMAMSAAVLGFVRPGQTINALIAVFTLYLVGTAWLAGRRSDPGGEVPDRIALVASLVLCAPFAVLIFQIVSGVTLVRTAFVIRGPILVALCVFAGVIATAALGDLHVVLARGLTGAARVARHLWRMCFALAMASGSAFTNGFARLLPGPYHVPPAFFAPQLIMLILLIYWLVRIRFPGWAGKPAKASLPAAAGMKRAGAPVARAPSA